jgi:phage recombination protein Bet
MPELSDRPERPKGVARSLTAQETAAAVRIAAGHWNEDECALIWSGMGANATFRDFQRFLYFCVQKDLDPLLNEIHAEFKWTQSDGAYRMAIITHIEAYRKLADQTGNYDGQEEHFYEPDGQLVSCTIRTFRKDCGRPFPYTAYYSEYKPSNAQNFSNWVKMPHVMLRKVAEAASLRCAFPKALAGAYIGEEMPQAGVQGESREEETPTALLDRKPQKKSPVPAAAPQPAREPEALKKMLERIKDRDSTQEVIVELRDDFLMLLGEINGAAKFSEVLAQHGAQGMGAISTPRLAKEITRSLYRTLAELRIADANSDPDEESREDWLPDEMKEGGALVNART